MELNQENIDALQINEVNLLKKIAQSLTVNVSQVSAVVGLLKDGSTVPFIARYRKEATGSLDEVAVRSTEHLWNSGLNMEGRRIEIIRGIFDQKKLTEALYENIMKAQTLSELEDIYAPYKRKKKTRGMLAEERGLMSLAIAMQELSDSEVEAKAAELVAAYKAPDDTENPEAASWEMTVANALEGAQDIIAEQVAQDTENRAAVKAFYKGDGKIVVKGIGNDDEKKVSVYQMYWDYTELLSQIKPHRILAINRGEREGKLEINYDVDEDGATERLQKNYITHNAYHKDAIEDGLKRLLSPAVIRELRSDAAEAADDHGIGVFSSNLKNLLMQQPIKGTRVLGIDPGIRTGTKCACMDETGKYLCYFVFKNDKVEEAKHAILRNIKDNKIQLIAIGNGTGSKDVQEIVAQVLAENDDLNVLYTVVDEDGASVYSASDVARDEFPLLDLTIRGAISIGRRLQDPLAELVKIDPKSIGVGLYQHDVNQKKLSETLDEVVSSVVNNVGVNLNTASASLLKYVSGINSSLAKKIVKYRDEKGKITNRMELVNVSGMGPKSYEQCAGFLRIPESSDELDNTWVHPENYEIARAIKNITVTGNLNSSIISELKEKYKVGDTTISDIVEELKKPGRDPREGFPKPIMQKGVVNFEDLTEGSMITGKIKNVVDFGAFVDLGIKETALVHISELSDTFIKDPMEIIKVGDVLEFRIIGLDTDRRRISLSRKTDSGGGEKKKVAVVKKIGAQQSGAPVGSNKNQFNSGVKRNAALNDDGSMYTPFADALKKLKNKS
ncbi:MAG: Tex family protein [Termitinemataceae bacterium]|nr:MAG: Tex family protein [Termitinemataceae bacterium]